MSSKPFQIENLLKIRELPLDFRKFFPIKNMFVKNLKIVAESSQIAHSIGNFIPKNLNETFFIKLTCEKIRRHFSVFSFMTPQNLDNLTYYVIYRYIFTLLKNVPI